MSLVKLVIDMNAIGLSLAVLLCGSAERASKSPVAVEKIVLASGKDKVTAHRFRPAGDGPFPALVALHGDFGLTPWVMQQARRLAEKGYVTLAVDLYRGELPKDIEEAHILERALPEERVLRDLKAAVDHLSARRDVSKDRLGIIGWDMGGGYALAGAVHDRRLRAVVTCYGRLITDTKTLARLNASVLGIFAGKDEGVPPETIDRFRAAMKKAGKLLATQVFAEAGSGFMDPESPNHDGPPAKTAIREAWHRIDSFLIRELRALRPGSRK
jgi:carboxymethylenebutenolidase